MAEQLLFWEYSLQIFGINVKIGSEAAQFPGKECINDICFFSALARQQKNFSVLLSCTIPLSTINPSLSIQEEDDRLNFLAGVRSQVGPEAPVARPPQRAVPTPPARPPTTAATETAQSAARQGQWGEI